MEPVRSDGFLALRPDMLLPKEPETLLGTNCWGVLVEVDAILETEVRLAPAKP